MRKFLRHITAVRGWLTGYDADTIRPDDLGTGTPDATKVLFGDGRWDDPSEGAANQSEIEGENKDTVPVQAGVPVMIHGSGTGVRRADAVDGGHDCVGLAVADTAVGFSVTVRTAGPFTLADWSAVTGGPTLTPKVPYYLSATAGRLTPDPPTTTGHRVQQVGVAVSADTLVLQILQPVLL